MSENDPQPLTDHMTNMISSGFSSVQQEQEISVYSDIQNSYNFIAYPLEENSCFGYVNVFVMPLKPRAKDVNLLKKKY